MKQKFLLWTATALLSMCVTCGFAQNVTCDTCVVTCDTCVTTYVSCYTDTTIITVINHYPVVAANPDIAFTENGICYDFVSETDVIVVPPTMTRDALPLPNVMETVKCCTYLYLVGDSLIGWNTQCDTTSYAEPFIDILWCTVRNELTLDNGMTYEYFTLCGASYNSYDENITIPTQVRGYNVLGVMPEVLSSFKPEYNVTNLNPVPQIFEYNGGVLFPGSKPTLYVPAASVTAYKNAVLWQDFNIVGIAPEVEVPDEGIVIIPSDTSALIVWTPNENAEGYRMFIYGDKEHTELICILEYDGLGQLVKMTFYKAKSNLQTASSNYNIAFNIEGLTSNTTYYYVLEELGDESVIGAVKKGDFTTNKIIITNANEISAGSAAIAGYYNILGTKLPKAPENGVYIILYDNGKVEKVVR